MFEAGIPIPVFNTCVVRGLEEPAIAVIYKTRKKHNSSKSVNYLIFYPLNLNRKICCTACVDIATY